MSDRNKDVVSSWLKQIYFSTSNHTWSLYLTDFQKLFTKEVKTLPETFQALMFMKSGNVRETDGEL